MAMGNTQRLAGKITGELESENLETQLEAWASEGSLLILITDQEGHILYSADEHSSVYRKKAPRQVAGSTNPYKSQDEPLSWQTGARHYLPPDYHNFLELLKSSSNGTVDYKTDDGTAYIYGKALPDSASLGAQAVLYMSTPLGGAGAAVGILQTQIFFVTLVSLVLATLLAWLISRQFSRPVAAITGQAKGLLNESHLPAYQKGFCRELDQLSFTIEETSHTLQRLENARKELLANVSHDLRTPLTMIRGYAEAIQEISWDNEKQRNQDLSVIIRETDRLTALVNDILEYSAAQSAGLKTELKTIDISLIAEEITNQFSPLFQQKGCEVVPKITPGLQALGDEKHIRRIFYNLLDNDLRYTQKQLTMTVELRTPVVRIEIEDDGKGISPEELPLIWDRYFTSKQRRGQGNSGLGLAITKSLLTAQKASFGVESQAGRGTAFWFELPLPENTEK